MKRRRTVETNIINNEEKQFNYMTNKIATDLRKKIIRIQNTCDYGGE